MATPKKLVCDRCGFEINDKDAIELALQGTASWQTFVREKGEEPRGLFPCMNYVRCNGEMVDPKTKNDRDKAKLN